MKELKRGLGIVAATLLILPAGADAQRGRMGDRGPGMRGGPDGPGVEAIMRMRERLELTDDQIAQLDALRREAVERRSAHRSQMDELRSQLAAGQIERDALREAVESRREGSDAMREQMRERVDGILTEAQREELDDLRAEGRAFMRGRASMRRDGPWARGMRGHRFDRPGFGRGFDGPRMAPFRGDGWGPPARGVRPFRRGGLE